MNKLNIDYLKLSSLVICLKASPDIIYQRILKDGKETRPLLNKPDPLGEIHKLLEFRAPFYNAATEYQIDTSALSIENVVEKILKIKKSAEP